MESNDTLAEPRYFTHLEETAFGIELPTKLNFPFCYEPHQIAIQAAEQLKYYIQQHLANGHLVLCMGAGSIDGWVRQQLVSN